MHLPPNWYDHLQKLSLSLILILGGSLLPAMADPIDDLPPGHWYAIPNTKLVDADAEPPLISEALFESIQGNSGVAGVVQKWSGGAWDTQRHRLFIFGGGHFGYKGNELYTFDLVTQSWNRHTLPAPEPFRDMMPAGVNSNPAEVSPATRHTYDGIAYVASIGRFLMVGNYGSPDHPDGGSSTWVVNPDASGNPWEVSTAPDADMDDSLYPCSAYDPLSDRVYTVAKNHLNEWNPSSRKWTKHPGHEWQETNGTCAIDPTRRIMVRVGKINTGSGVHLWNLEPLSSRVTIYPTGDTDLENQGAPGFAYDPMSDKFVGWNGGTDVYTLEWDTKAWTKIPAAARNTTNPGAVANDGGTFGRFQYVPAKNVFILVNNPNDNVYVYRLSDAPPPSPPSPPSNLQVN